MIVITGASSGIGAATAEAFSKKKYDLLLCGRDEEKLGNVAAVCRSNGSYVDEIIGDVRAESFRKAVVKRVAKSSSTPTLIASAGMGHFGAPLQLSDSHWNEVIDVNLNSVFFLVRDVCDVLKKREQSTVVVVSSDADSMPFEDAAAYGASKAGLSQLMHSLRLSMRGFGIRISTLSPGRVDTCFNGKSVGMRPGALTAEEVAECIRFLVECPENLEVSEMRIDSMGR